MKAVFTLAVMVCLLVPLTAHAEYYQYRGADGAIHFTDNLADVPPAQRPGVKRFKEIKRIAAPAAQKPLAHPASEKPASGQPVAGSGNANLQIQAQALEKRGKALSRAYDQLQAERKNLGPPVGSGAPLNAIQIYEDKVKALNQRIVQYSKQRQAYQKDVDAFNARVKAAQ